MGDRIRRLRTLRGLSQDRFAEALDTNRISVNRWETGKAEPSQATLRRLVAWANVPEAWLRYGNGSGPVTVAVVGAVGAAQTVIPVEGSGVLDEIEAPFGTPPDMRALIVKGDSMLPELSDGDYVLYREATQRIEDLVGRRVVAQLEDGRVLVKRLRRGTALGRWTLESTNAAPLEDVAIIAAAKVEGVVYR